MNYYEVVDALKDRGWVEGYENALIYTKDFSTNGGKRLVVLAELVDADDDGIQIISFEVGEFPDSICLRTELFASTDNGLYELEAFISEVTAELTPRIEQMLANYYDSLDKLDEAGFSSNYDSNMDCFQSQYILKLDSDKLFIVNLESPECLLLQPDESVDSPAAFDYSYGQDSTNLAGIYATIEDEDGRIYWSGENNSGDVMDIFTKLEGDSYN